MPTPARTSAFISYSHADEKWRKLLEDHLTPLMRDNRSLRIWSDQNLNAGEPWLARIRKELATAKVGILLVSKKFLASDFIHSQELPPLLAAAKSEGVTLLTIIVGHCYFKGSPLSALQTFNKPEKPLVDLTPAQRDKEMVRLCAKIMKLFGLKAGKPKPAKDKAAPKKPKRITTIKAGEKAPEAPKRKKTAAPKTAADEAAAKAKAIARQKAIAKKRREAAAAAKKLAVEQAPAAPKKPAALKKPAAKPATTRATKKKP